MTHKSDTAAMAPRGVLREKAASAYVGLSVRDLQRKRTEGGGPPYVRLGTRAVGYAVADLDAWLKARTFASTSAEDAARGSKAA